jgi:hypothetical protein
MPKRQPRSGIPTAVRREVLERDGHRCVTCGYSNEADLVLDHVEFWASGGSDEASNLRTLCCYCNRRRSDMHSADDFLSWSGEPLSGEDLCCFFLRGFQLPAHPTLIVPSLQGLTNRFSRHRWIYETPRRLSITDEEFHNEFRRAPNDWNARRPDLRLPFDLEDECGRPCRIIMSRLVTVVLSFDAASDTYSKYHDFAWDLARSVPCYERYPPTR